MALSLLQHIRDTQATPLHHAVQEMGLSATQATMLLDWTLPLVLAHLVDLNQRHGTGLVLALVNTQAVDGIWQTLDQAEWISQVQKQLPADGLVLQVASHHLATVVLAEIFALVDAASLGEEGLNELLEGQPEHLQGQAPDWVWQQAGLNSLCGQAAVEPEPSAALDLAAGIASLNQLVRQAATHPVKDASVQPTPTQPDPSHPSVEHAVTSPDLNTTASHHAADAHHAHPLIVMPVQRDAGRLTRLFEPLIAAGLLVFLSVLFSQSNLPITPVTAPLSYSKPTLASQETALIPTVVASENDLPPMAGGQPDLSEIQRATEEAQRTGTQALQFSDNSLSE
ncbi:MAG: hypothetical protein WA154_09435 [Moraxellaceae bacterium]